MDSNDGFFTFFFYSTLVIPFSTHTQLRSMRRKEKGGRETSSAFTFSLRFFLHEQQTASEKKATLAHEPLHVFSLFFFAHLHPLLFVNNFSHSCNKSNNKKHLNPSLLRLSACPLDQTCNMIHCGGIHTKKYSCCGRSLLFGVLGDIQKKPNWI